LSDANPAGGKKEKRPGRAAFVPSDDQRATVRRMASERLGHVVIAAEIGISVPTLRKVFVEELRDRVSSGGLFGDAAELIPSMPPPPSARPKRRGAGGRKSYRPTDRDREKVEVLVAAGMNVDDIARAMSIAEPTLRKHYGRELETGALRKRGEMLVALNRAALKGNVAAVKEALAIMDRADLATLQDQVRGKGKTDKGDQASAGDSSPASPPASEALGKKVQAELDAHGVVTQGPWSALIRNPQKAS
jgi:DNA-binding transcriptional MerR regulator